MVNYGNSRDVDAARATIVGALSDSLSISEFIMLELQQRARLILLFQPAEPRTEFYLLIFPIEYSIVPIAPLTFLSGEYARE